MTFPAWLHAGDTAASEVTVHVQPGAAHDGLAGVHGDALKIRIRARAIDGAANAALLGFVADLLGLPRRAVSLVRGEKSRRKTLSVDLAPLQVAARLNVHPDPDLGIGTAARKRTGGPA